ncbi:uncharacterized protein N7459_006942 [Penicillium hispanicum]|uniref:uncharacterized protein n=1 Tax=Penicillium hispanicum TaxID=1080232 RepID=UPI0025405318|nr:uncharacterized protein N7459_006942 [Penicillium hispanicum]KAJ5577978.1 hypothetical protein N7459_006942 [Penicillium hispanicum]
MAPPNLPAAKLAVVPPPPSFDPTSYQPFDDQVDRTIDQILSEEASLESSKDDEWFDNNLLFGSRSASGSSSLSAHQTDGAAGHSRYFSKPPFPTRRDRPRRTTRVATKNITMVDIASDDEDDRPNEGKLGQNAFQPKEKHPKKKTRKEKKKRPLEDTRHAAGNGMDGSESAINHVAELTGQDTANENDEAEEDALFASVKPSQRDRIMQFVVTHPFMKTPVQPVQCSARRQFTNEIRTEALSAGMDAQAVDNLVDYVRRIYLELAEVPSTPSANGFDTAFGEEIDDAESTHSLKGHKRCLDEQTPPKKQKKRKKNKRRHSKTSRHSQLDRSSEDCYSFENFKLPQETSEAQSMDTGIGAVSPYMDESPELLSEIPITARRDAKKRIESYTPVDSQSQRHEPRLSHAKASEGIGDNLRSPILTPEQKVEHGQGKNKISVNRERQNLPAAAVVDLVDDNRPSDTGTGLIAQPEGMSRKKKRHSSKRRKRRDSEQQRRQSNVQITEDASPQTPQPVKTLHRGQVEVTTPPSRTSKVMPGDEVRSKYFHMNMSVPEPGLENAAPIFPLSGVPIPDETRRILQKLDLPSDFLSSDSSLSDAPGNLDLEDELPVRPFVTLSSTEGPELPPSDTVTNPCTPVKSANLLKPDDSKESRPRPPKISPYFPKFPSEPESCLPFPPIDAPTFGLVQEQLAHEPFKLLIATIFLNRTRGGVALPVLFKVFERYPTIDAMAAADPEELVSMIHCLGFQNQRAKKCITIARVWQTDPPTKNRRYRKIHYPHKLDGRDVGSGECLDDEDPRAAWEIAHLPGVGAYSLDSWRIFCRDELRELAADWKGTGATMRGFVPEWKSVLPQDKELRAYLTWLWLKEGWVWDRYTGDLTPASDKMLRAAQKGGVAHEEDGNWVLEMSPVKAANGLHDD